MVNTQKKDLVDSVAVLLNAECTHCPGTRHISPSKPWLVGNRTSLMTTASGIVITASIASLQEAKFRAREEVWCLACKSQSLRPLQKYQVFQKAMWIADRFSTFCSSEWNPLSFCCSSCNQLSESCPYAELSGSTLSFTCSSRIVSCRIATMAFSF